MLFPERGDAGQLDEGGCLRSTGNGASKARDTGTTIALDRARSCSFSCALRAYRSTRHARSPDERCTYHLRSCVPTSTSKKSRVCSTAAGSSELPAGKGLEPVVTRDRGKHGRVEIPIHKYPSRVPKQDRDPGLVIGLGQSLDRGGELGVGELKAFGLGAGASSEISRSSPMMKRRLSPSGMSIPNLSARATKSRVERVSR
jgi:hypothetical protein